METPLMLEPTKFSLRTLETSKIQPVFKGFRRISQPYNNSMDFLGKIVGSHLHFVSKWSPSSLKKFVEVKTKKQNKISNAKRPPVPKFNQCKMAKVETDDFKKKHEKNNISKKK